MSSRRKPTPPHLYDEIGATYASFRRPDPRIAESISRALGPSASILNVGAGSGSYEPTDRRVVAVEPSTLMIRQRPPRSAPAVQAVATALPFEDHAFDAGLALLTLHHWPDWRAGLSELRRVVRDRVVLLTWEPEAHPFWLYEYFPEILSMDLELFPPMADFSDVLGPIDIRPVPIPHDCTDGFLCAYWRRPELYLDDDRRRAISSFTKIDTRAGLERLRSDLRSGAWEKRHGAIRGETALDFGYRLVVARGGTDD